MSPGRDWREVKAEAHRLYPELADPQRQAAADAHLDAYVASHQRESAEKAHPALGTSQAPDSAARANAKGTAPRDASAAWGWGGRTPQCERLRPGARSASPTKALPLGAYFRSCRAMTMRWIWFVPS